MAETADLANPALKEWAVVNRALRDGRQIIDLRKGGVREQGHRFRVRALRFWLYDSFEHQRAELVRPEFAAELAASHAAQPPAGALRFEAWAEIVATAALTEPEQVAALEAEHVWTPDYAVQRFRWRPKTPLLVLVLRVHRLAAPLEVAARPAYASCTSWVPMLDLPPDPAALPAAPVLADGEFVRRFELLQARLHERLPDALPGVTFESPAVTADAR